MHLEMYFLGKNIILMFFKNTLKDPKFNKCCYICLYYLKCVEIPCFFMMYLDHVNKMYNKYF